MNSLSTAERVAIVRALVEGNSINSTARICGVSKPAVLKILIDVGNGCLTLHDSKVRNVNSKRIQCDETWSFVGMKQRNVPAEQKANNEIGDAWVWCALDADSKLMVSYRIGKRSSEMADDLMYDLADRLAGRVQLTTDAFGAYKWAVRQAFDRVVDFGSVVKIYGPERAGAGRYSPPVCIAAEKREMIGNPDWAHISTSFVERSNLTMRMSMRRFTRLTNGYSKKFANHCAMVHIFFCYYNFVRVHATTKQTPAVAAGLADRAWTIEELVALAPIEAPKKRGPYKVRPTPNI